MTLYQKFLKRTFDFAAACIGLIVLALPMLLISLLVKCASRGAGIYKQSRIGRNAKLFTCIKFRTMLVNSESQGTITTAVDKRVTPVGRLLRRFKLDELPQLWNVLIGNMSFVGPRPDVAGYADTLAGDDRRILDLRPGITGPATLAFRDEENLLAAAEDPKRYNDEVIWPQKVEINKRYLAEWSFWKDMGYILVTVFPMLDRFFRLVPRVNIR